MKRQVNYQYYVEGETEKYLLDILKTEMRCIVPGKVDKFNVIQERLTNARIRTLKQDTVIVLVFDTDVERIDILNDNIRFLEKQTAVKEVICVPQIRNLEEELLHCCNIKSVGEITNSNSKKDEKRDLLLCRNLCARLKKCGFSVEKLWCKTPEGLFAHIENGANKIKK